MSEEPTEEERRLTRLVADQGAQIARLTQSLRFNEMIIKELRHEVAEERAAVVAWLRERAAVAKRRDISVAASVLEEAADAIERGEHRREEER